MSAFETCPDPDVCTLTDGNNVGLAFGLTIGAGLSTCIGAAIPLFMKSQNNKKFLSVGLAISAGVMLYVSYIEIFVKSLNYMCCIDDRYYPVATTGLFFLGAILTELLHQGVHRLEKVNLDDLKFWEKKNKRNNSKQHSGSLETSQPTNTAPSTMNDTIVSDKEPASKDEPMPGFSLVDMNESGTVVKLPRHDEEDKDKDDDGNDDDVDEDRISRVLDVIENESEADLEHDNIAREKKKLKKMGLMSALAISIHNFPEGLATFVAALSDPAFGISLAIAIAIHNIPEGFIVSLPIYYSTGSRVKAFLWAFLSGIAEVVGALLGFLILKDSFGPGAYGVIFGLVAGMMTYISFRELIPTALKYGKSGMVTISLFIGMFIMALSLVLFQVI